MAFIIPFITILLAEFLDKSQVTILLLASKTKKHTSLLLASILAFAIVDGIAMIFGAAIINLIPALFIKLLSGLLFLFFGLLSLRKANANKTKVPNHVNFGNVFLLVFLSEWGDKTQLAAAVFATRFPLLPAFLGIITALGLLSLIAVIVGKSLTRFSNREQIEKVSGVVFILLGIFFLLS